MRNAAETNVRRWLVRAEGTAAVAAGAAAIVAMAVAAVVDGWPAACSAGLGSGDVFIFFALGALIGARALRTADWSAGAAVLGGYGLRVGLLTIVAVGLAHTPWMASATWFGVGVAGAALAWVAGLLGGHVTGRWPIYDIDPPVLGVAA